MSHSVVSVAAPVIAFREMEASDIPAVEALARRIWNGHYPPIIGRAQTDYMNELFNSAASLGRQMQEYRFLLAEDKDALAGYIAVKEEEPGCYYISKYYVDTTRRRSGIGVMLFEEIIRRFSPRVLTLHVNIRNYTAINFYFRRGFTISATKVSDIGGGFVMDDFVMKKIVYVE